MPKRAMPDSAWETRRKCARYSVLPLVAPLMGDSIVPLQAKPAALMPNTTSRSTSSRTKASLMTPRVPTFSLPASNCGLMRMINSPASGFNTSQTLGSTLSTDMKERSRVTKSTSSGRSDARRCRRLHLSMAIRRGSWRSFSATCPRPTSMPYTRSTPFCSRQSVKPPVESPASRATLPQMSRPQWSSAASSLSPARHTYLGTSAMSSTATSWES
mmetsp:Transcript_20987/g.50094  ORF Transcript_20987/g.50094 Transcript_20987/m.50094 type:complete len:215 (-) Transcript_20987:199-843(-)